MLTNLRTITQGSEKTSIKLIKDIKIFLPPLEIMKTFWKIFPTNTGSLKANFKAWEMKTQVWSKD